MENNRVCILGMGYVGLTLGVVMAECGYDVTGIEINPETVKSLQKGVAHFHEVGLNPRLGRQLRLGNLRVTENHLDDNVRKCGIFMITVGTPLGTDGKPRMDMVERAANQLAQVLQDDSIVILRSTVKLGTSRDVVKPILDATGKRYMLAYCPERTIEGKALEELRSLPQVVGGLEPDHAWRAAQVFARMTPTTIRVSCLEAAEVVKLLDNSFRDMSFAFGNEVALLCEAAGLDGVEVIYAANTGYLRTNIAMPGLVGGPCLEKDPHILKASLERNSFVPELIGTGRRINEELPSRIVGLIQRELGGVNLNGKKVSICGLAFKGKPETDDLRGTPSLHVIDAIKAVWPDAKLYGQDFAVNDDGIRSLGLEPLGIEEAFKDASLVVVATNHAKYQWLDVDPLLGSMQKPALVYDIWNMLEIDHGSEPDGVKYVRLGSATAWRCS